MKVLVVEDDKIILEGLCISLIQEGYEIRSADTMKKALELVENEKDFDICLLDVMLPDGDGFTVCKTIRKHGGVPVIFLTACDDEIHTVLALEQGADDYITKPFRIRELLARMKAVLRRTGVREESNVVWVGENQINIQNGKVYRKGNEILLTALEYKLLLIFINNAGNTISRRQILNAIWD